ncbi:uncharacterized protein LOC114531989 isoform X2 [Dendronephthya gigantea]|nr:uncharacterized protein LOC114531989 isoform X2 [Dendronephthya gigantea]
MLNGIVESTSNLIEQVKEHLKQKVLNCVENGADKLTEESVEEIFNSFEDPFSKLKTTYLQSSFLESSVNFIKPIQYVLSTRITYKNKGSKRLICEQDDTMVYIPILDSLQQLLSNSKIADVITAPRQVCKEGFLFDICDGECIKHNRIFIEHPNGLIIILYHDEIEVCNPLGTHVGKHKIDLYYYTLGNIGPKYRSKLCAIRLLAIVKAKDVSMYGQNKILTPIINDLHTLANGYTFVVGGNFMELFGGVVSCLGDTEGQHQWGGFKVKVGFSHQKCRNCLCTFLSMQENFRASCFTERNLVQYRQHCEDIETAPTEESRKNLVTTYGINERSVLSRLPQFDITKQLPQDIMHVLLEGSVQYEVRYALQYFIDNGSITLQQLNSTFCQLKLGYQDEANRPPPLRETVFNGQEKYKLKQTAEHARIFLKYLPICLKNFVANDCPQYQLILQISLIVQICFSPVISVETIKELETLIEANLILFKEVFPGVNITPKMHYMLHIPQQIVYLGPLVRHCCLRFEARHRYFKDLAPLQNFKNICLSLAERCQVDECADFETQTPCQHPLFKSEKVIGPSSMVTDMLKAHFFQRITDCLLYANPESLTNVFTCKWIQLHGTKYVPNKGCIIAVDATFTSMLPEFGRIQRIWLADEDTIFEYTPLKTVEFNDGLLSYEVEDPGDGVPTKFCLYASMLDFNVYSTLKQFDSTFIPTKYDLRDLIRLHVVGENPLHR